MRSTPTTVLKNHVCSEPTVLISSTISAATAQLVSLGNAVTRRSICVQEIRASTGCVWTNCSATSVSVILDGQVLLAKSTLTNVLVNLVRTMDSALTEWTDLPAPASLVTLARGVSTPSTTVPPSLVKTEELVRINWKDLFASADQDLWDFSARLKLTSV